MKKSFLLTALIATNLFFAQLSEKEAKEAFKNSNIRKELGFKSEDFNFKLLTEKSKQYNVPLENMLILNKTDDENLINQIKSDYQRKENKDGAYCIYCSDIPYYDIIKKNFEERDPETPYN